MKKSLIWCVASLAAVLALPATAAELARPRVHPTGIEWEPLATASGVLQLSYTIGDVEVEHRFTAGRWPSISIWDADGQPLPDGTYAWELIRVPPPIGDVRDPENGRDRAPEGAAAPVRRTPRQYQMGYFTVRGGLLVDPDLEEPQGRGRRD